MSLFGLIGRQTIEFVSYLGGLAVLARQTLYWTLAAPFRGRFPNWRNTIKQMSIVGFDAIPIVTLIAFFIGVIMALQSGYQLKKLGAINYVVNIVALSISRELGPLMTAIILVGRSGSAFAAELGTMEVGEEIDALKTMGMNPVRYLVVPKMLAMMIMLPCLTMWADLMGIFGGATFAYSQIDMTFKRYMVGTIDALLLHDVITGLIKSVVFAIIITTISCHEGFKVKGGAEGVGRSTTSSVVTSMFVVILADMIFTAIFFFLE